MPDVFRSLVLAQLFFFGLLHGDPRGFAPVDEAARDSSFLAFRERFVRALATHDTLFLFEEVFDPDLVTNRDQISPWGLMNALAAGDENYWKSLEQTVSLGGGFLGDTLFFAPYVFSAWPDSLDPVGYGAVIAPEAPLYVDADTGSAVLARLSREIVRVIELQGPMYDFEKRRNWREVVLEDGRRGYVKINRLRSPLDLRLGFRFSNGGWRLKYYIRGVQPPAPKVLILPIDEAARDSSFFNFRTRLSRAVEEKDTSFIFSILAPGITFNFGWGNGPDEFRKFWKFDQGLESEFWDEMRTVLSMGGGFRDKDFFFAPYIWTRWRSTRVGDAFEYTAALEGARLYERPDTLSAVLRRVDYELLRNQENPPVHPENWLAVVTHDCRAGWVLKESVRSPIDYRAGFRRENGRWVLEFFVAGD